MKQLQRLISFLAAFALVFSMVPDTLWAKAANTAYTVLTEPNFRGGFENETYGDVAAVWEYVYYEPAAGTTNNNKAGEWKPMYLMRADESGLHRVSDYYKEVTGFSETGHAAAKNFEGKWGIINYKGEIIFNL